MIREQKMQQALKISYFVDFRKKTELKPLIRNKTLLPLFPCYKMDGTNATNVFPLNMDYDIQYPGERL